MLGKASSLGCTAGSTADAADIVCLCNNADFTHGIVDCSNEACGNDGAGAAQKVIQYGADNCAGMSTVQVEYHTQKTDIVT
jgi:hypothetical protein